MNSLLKFCAFFTIFRGSSASLLPSSCAEILVQGNTQSGIYTIHPRPWYGPYPFQVYCDMKTDGGGWTLFQKREDYEIHENFFRNWSDYKIGFGDLNKEFWLGNDNLYVLTAQDRVTLRIELEDFEGNTRYAEYKTFQVSDERNNYNITISDYRGDAGNSMSYLSKGALFTTVDKNENNNKCAQTYKGGWWYTQCHNSNLNGVYLKGNHSSRGDGINWEQWLGYYYSHKRTEMKVRPNNFSPHPHFHV